MSSEDHRLLTLTERFKTFVRTVKYEMVVYQFVLRDSRTPWYAKATLGLAVGYFVLPIDLIPDFIPVLGQLDDILIVPGLIWLSLKLIPPEVVADNREKAKESQESVSDSRH